MPQRFLKPFLAALTGILILFGLYFGIISLISGWAFAQDQFSRYWYYLLILILGFGLQIGLYVYLKNEVAVHAASGKIVVLSGATSTFAMLACCSHYLPTLLPFLGVAGALTIFGQYQVELFWVGIVFNLIGISVVARKILYFKKSVYEI